jgi:hypothetical protein
VFVRPEDAGPLRDALAQTMEVVPGDPLEGLSREELEAMVQRPMMANLVEQALAQRILTLRGAEPAPVAEPAAAAVTRDPFAAADARLARWIGGLAVLLPLVLIVTSLSLTTHGWEEAVAGPAIYMHTGVSGPLTPEDSFDAPLRVFLFVLAPLAAGGALGFARRRLPGGAVRWMFPPGWRRMGRISLLVSLLFYLVSLAYLVYWWTHPVPVE